jgi:hypothetical protein
VVTSTEYGEPVVRATEYGQSVVTTTTKENYWLKIAFLTNRKIFPTWIKLAYKTTTTTGKESNSANVLRSGEKSESVTAVPRRDAAGQLLTPCSNTQRCQQKTRFWWWHTRGQMSTWTGSRRTGNILQIVNGHKSHCSQAPHIKFRYQIHSRALLTKSDFFFKMSIILWEIPPSLYPNLRSSLTNCTSDMSHTQITSQHVTYRKRA